MKVTITIPSACLVDAISMRDRIESIILQDDETASITAGGVAIRTANPARVSLELMAEGLID
jgi:hypothetical protein